MVLGLAGTIGLLLASSGLYGLISYSVAQRVREIGVRMALGAGRGDVLTLIIREGLAVSAVGIALGFVLTYGVIRIVSRFVVALPSIDLVTFCAVPDASRRGYPARVLHPRASRRPRRSDGGVERVVEVSVTQKDSKPSGQTITLRDKS